MEVIAKQDEWYACLSYMVRCFSLILPSNINFNPLNVLIMEIIAKFPVDGTFHMTDQLIHQVRGHTLSIGNKMTPYLRVVASKKIS